MNRILIVFRLLLGLRGEPLLMTGDIKPFKYQMTNDVSCNTDEKSMCGTRRKYRTLSIEDLVTECGRFAPWHEDYKRQHCALFQTLKEHSS